jgi:hypothetical protein
MIIVQLTVASEFRPQHRPMYEILGPLVRLLCGFIDNNKIIKYSSSALDPLTYCLDKVQNVLARCRGFEEDTWSCSGSARVQYPLRIHNNFTSLPHWAEPRLVHGRFAYTSTRQYGIIIFKLVLWPTDQGGEFKFWPMINLGSRSYDSGWWAVGRAGVGQSTGNY